MAAAPDLGIVTVFDGIPPLPSFRIIDLRSTTIEPELHAEAKSPEQAAESALGMKLVRAGHPRNLVCRVYWQDAASTNMVRLYSKVLHPASHASG
jgi:phage-related baseplate assembly protein